MKTDVDFCAAERPAVRTAIPAGPLARSLEGLSGRVLLVTPRSSEDVSRAAPAGMSLAHRGATDMAAQMARAPQPHTPYDAVVFVGCAGQVGQLVLGSWAHDLLTADGVLVVMDHLVSDTSAYFDAGDCYVERFLVHTLARCGFELSGQTPIDDAESAPCAARHELLQFRRAERRWRIADAQYVEPAAMQSLFGRVFNHDISAELWDWKYGDGRGVGVVAWAADEVIAHYGCLTRRIMLRGTPARALQVCDVMVATPERGTLSRKGPFFMTAASAAEQFLLHHDIGFGFPNQRAMAVAERLGLYQKVDQLVSVHWGPGAHRPLLRTRVRPLDLARDAATVDALWARMAADADELLIGVRDAAYVKHRYFAHPRQHYQAFLISQRFSGKPLGVIVMRAGEGDACELVDLIGPFALFPYLVAQARRVCARQGGRSLYCWMSEHTAPLLSGPDGEVRALDVCIPTSIWGAGPDVATITGRWWLMGGDTDFR
ncbi:MAG: GNAT family N-acetyltransferase [Rhodocyclales bacterium]|nr:GNAT family N-acetyltransferase [Rhodocyclales bacterium]